MILLFKGVMFGCHVSFQNVTLISRQGMWERVPGTYVFKKKQLQTMAGTLQQASPNPPNVYIYIHIQVYIYIQVNATSEDVNTTPTNDTKYLFGYFLLLSSNWFNACMFTPIQFLQSDMVTGLESELQRAQLRKEKTKRWLKLVPDSGYCVSYRA